MVGAGRMPAKTTSLGGDTMSIQEGFEEMSNYIGFHKKKKPVVEDEYVIEDEYEEDASFSEFDE